MRSAADAALLRSLATESRGPVNGEKSAASRLIAAGLVEEVGAHYWEHGRKRGRRLRLTRAGQVAAAKLPKPRCVMLPGDGVRHDCIHAALCIGAFAAAYPTTDEAHCPAGCVHRQDVRRELGGYGSSSLAQMQQYAFGHF